MNLAEVGTTSCKNPFVPVALHGPVPHGSIGTAALLVSNLVSGLVRTACRLDAHKETAFVTSTVTWFSRSGTSNQRTEQRIHWLSTLYNQLHVHKSTQAEVFRSLPASTTATSTVSPLRVTTTATF